MRKAPIKIKRCQMANRWNRGVQKAISRGGAKGLPHVVTTPKARCQVRSAKRATPGAVPKASRIYDNAKGQLSKSAKGHL